MPFGVAKSRPIGTHLVRGFDMLGHTALAGFFYPYPLSPVVSGKGPKGDRREGIFILPP